MSVLYRSLIALTVFPQAVRSATLRTAGCDKSVTWAGVPAPTCHSVLMKYSTHRSGSSICRHTVQRVRLSHPANPMRNTVDLVPPNKTIIYRSMLSHSCGDWVNGISMHAASISLRTRSLLPDRHSVFQQTPSIVFNVPNSRYSSGVASSRDNSPDSL